MTNCVACMLALLLQLRRKADAVFLQKLRPNGAFVPFGDAPGNGKPNAEPPVLDVRD